MSAQPEPLTDRLRALAAGWETTAKSKAGARSSRVSTAYYRCAADVLALLDDPADEARADEVPCHCWYDGPPCPRHNNDGSERQVPVVAEPTPTGWHRHQTQGGVRDSDCQCSHGIRNVPAPPADTEAPSEVETLAEVLEGAELSWDFFPLPDAAIETVARMILAAGYLSPTQVRVRERAAWEMGRQSGHWEVQMGSMNATDNPFAGDA